MYSRGYKNAGDMRLLRQRGGETECLDTKTIVPQQLERYLDGYK